MVASGSDDCLILIWDITNGKIIKSNLIEVNVLGFKHFHFRSNEA